MALTKAVRLWSWGTGGQTDSPHPRITSCWGLNIEVSLSHYVHPHRAWNSSQLQAHWFQFSHRLSSSFQHRYLYKALTPRHSGAVFPGLSGKPEPLRSWSSRTSTWERLRFLPRSLKRGTDKPWPSALRETEPHGGVGWTFVPHVKNPCVNSEVMQPKLRSLGGI